ncbi:MAG: CoA transferase [Dehalococcoidia bacterium]|nr:CoA transferase [Dehalococcoidia bacterium]
MTAHGPLSGVTVLEVGDGVPVGYAGRVLRSLGAHVLKLEDAAAPDWVRGYGSPFGGHRAAASWYHLNGAKHRAVLGGGPAAALARLMAASDLTLVGDGTLAHLIEPALALDGAGLPSVVRIVPAVTPPTGMMLRADESAGAATGLRDVYGMGRPPEGLRFDIAEVNAGAHAAAVGALALYRRTVTGEPVRVDVGVYEATFSMIEIAVQTLLLSQAFDSSSPDMVGSPLAAPYYCADGGAVVINIYGRGVWQRTCAAIGRPDLEDDPRFIETFARYEFGQELRDLLDAFCLAHPRDEAMRRLWGQRIPSAPVLEPAELVQNEQVASRGIVAGNRLASPYVINGERDPLEPVGAAQACALFETLCAGWATTDYREDLDAVHIAVR